MNAIKSTFGYQEPPPPPDYTGAAKATAAGNLEAAKYATVANRANQNTPYGSLTWQRGATDYDPWTQTINLSETGRQLLDADNRSALGLASLQENAGQRVGEKFASPFDYSNADDAVNAAYDFSTSRLDDQFGRRQAQLENQLANQGIARGTEAWTNAMKDFDYGRNDAYSQARTNAFNMAPTQFQLAAAIRNQPLNELNSLRTGSQVTNPTFNNYAQQSTTAGADYLGATNAGYNALVGATNANNAFAGNVMDGLFSIGSAYAGKK